MINYCNTCGSVNKKFLFSIGKYTLVKCSNCDLVYIENPLTFSDAKDRYEAENYTGYDGTTSTSDYAVGEYFRAKESSDRLDRIIKIAPKKINSALDVGCGAGFFVKIASRRLINAVGIDVSQKAVEYGKNQGLNLIETDLLSLNDFEDESFDLITFWGVVGNLYHPKETLQKAHKLLKNNGLLVIETGDIGSYQAKIFGKKWRVFNHHHYNNFYYSSATLDDLLKRTGFRTIRTDHDGFVESLLESLAMQLKLQKLLSGVFAKISRNPNNKKISHLKEVINRLADKIRLGDVMIKYAVKER